MIYLEILFWAWLIISGVYVAFNLKDFINWWWVKSKNVYKKVSKMIQGWFK